MQGFPKWFNTRQDVDLCLVEYPEEMKAKLREWLENRFVWVTTATLPGREAGIEDATHRIIEETADSGSPVEYLQQGLQVDPNYHLFRLGFTVEEAERII